MVTVNQMVIIITTIIIKVRFGGAMVAQEKHVHVACSRPLWSLLSSAAPKLCLRGHRAPSLLTSSEHHQLSKGLRSVIPTNNNNHEVAAFPLQIRVSEMYKISNSVLC